MSRILITLLLLAGLHGPVSAAPTRLEDHLADLAHRWAKANYQTPSSQKGRKRTALLGNAEQLVQTNPGRAEPMVWQAIILSSAAKAQGGLGALGKVKEARDLLLTAEKIDARAMDGSVYNTLGSLYAKVPRWPIGFGDKQKAREYFEKALAINANGLDVNYFYADLLADQGDYASAAEHLRRALAAPPRPGREDADSGRRQEARLLLDGIQRKHGDQLASK